MRLNINLATKPFQDVRRVLLRWGGLVLLLAVCTVALLWMAVSNWRESREVSAKIVELKSEIAALDRQHDEAVELVRLPQNSPVVDTSKFLNGLIARKSFSWTRVFMQMEEILPPRLHVSSISPQLQPLTNTMEVHMTVAGTSRDSALELVKRLEVSPSFRDARIVEESEIHDKLSSDTVQFHLSAIYVPRPPGAADSTVPAKVPSANAPQAKVPPAKVPPAKVALAASPATAPGAKGAKQ